MPIKPELRHFYGKEWRTVTRPRILARAGNKCENCAAPNHKQVLRAAGWWTPGDTDAAFRLMYTREMISLPWRHAPNIERVAGFPREICHRTFIVLTVAHLNHTPGDDRPENLKALCQWCHLNYDKDHHRESRAARKDATRPLLGTANV